MTQPCVIPAYAGMTSYFQSFFFAFLWPFPFLPGYPSLNCALCQAGQG
jgi:hypothetical protein